MSAQTFSKLLQSDYVTAEEFGAMGDGKHDDTKALLLAIATQKNIFLLGKTYVINQPLIIDVDKQCINGVAGESRIKCSEKFIGDFCLKFVNPSPNYYSRWHRVRKNGNFSIDGGKRVNGILIGDTIRNSGNEVDELYFENIFIEYARSAVVLGNHFYKNTFINCIFRENSYSLRSCEGQYDCGESVAFYDCAFWDGGKGINVKCGLYFYTCTFHVPIVANNCLLNFFGCHFERVKSNTFTGAPLFVAKNNANILINGGTAVISNNATWVCKDAVLVAEKNSSIKVVDADWNYFLRGVTTDTKEYIARGDVIISGLKMPEKYEKGINAKQFFMETSSNSFPAIINSENLLLKANDIDGNNHVDITKGENGIINISLAANKKKNNNNVWIGKLIPIPCGKRNVWAQEELCLHKSPNNSSYSLNFQTNSPSFYGLAFLDADKQIIQDSDNRPFYSNVKSSSKTDVDYSYSRIVCIPTNASFVLFGVSFLINDSSDNLKIDFDITKFCVEFL